MDNIDKGVCLSHYINYCLGQKLFIYDAGYRSKKYSDQLSKAIQELIDKQSISSVEAIFSHKHPGLNIAIKNRVIEQVEVLTPTNISPSSCLETVQCTELKRLPLDLPNSSFEDKEVFKNISLLFYFNRRYPLVKYDVHTLATAQRELAQHSQPGAEEQSNRNGNNELNSQENDVLVHITSPACHSSVLITGKTPVEQFKIENLDSIPLSVFIVPHQEIKECLSLLPEETRKCLTDPTALQNAALHLALYHKRNSFIPFLDIKLKQTKLNERGKEFRQYYLNKKSISPEAELNEFLQDPNLRLCSFLHTANPQLSWYKEQEHGAFSDLAKSISEEVGMQYKRLEFLRNSLAWAQFYRHINAEVFVISAEDFKQQTELEVLNGIIISRIWKKTNCCIMITGNILWPLDSILQRDVRKFISSDTNSTVRFGFLDEYSPRTPPYFTINPWSQAQTYQSPHHIITVDSSGHVVTGIGNEPALPLITDRLDIIELISTKESEQIIGHLKYNSRPPTAYLKKATEKKLLEAYLKGIGFKIAYGSYKLCDVLDCTLGPLLVQQLKELGTKDVSGFEVIPTLLEQHVSGNSTFVLTPTLSSASSAEIDVPISRKHPLQLGERRVQSARFSIKKARTVRPHITLKLITDSQTLSLDISRHLDFEGTCGTTIADHIYSTCFEEDAWIHAKNRTVGEVLNVFLHEKKALLVIQSLPLFLSVPLIKCKVNHYLSTVLVDTASQVLQEAHIYVDSFDLPSVSVNGHKLAIHINSLAMHLFPTHDVEYMVKIEGRCTLNKCISMKMTCSSTEDPIKHVEFLFGVPQTAKEMFDLFQIEPPSNLACPVGGYSINYSTEYKVGFILSQKFKGTKEHSVTSLFFSIEPSDDCIKQILPSSLSGHIENVKGKIVVNYMSERTPELQFEAIFTLRFDFLDTAKLECKLAVSPSDKVLFVMKSRKQICGQSVVSAVSAVDSTLGKSIENQFNATPTLRKQILKVMSLKKVQFCFINCKVELFDLCVTVPELDISPGKVSIRECALKMCYCTEGLTIDYSGVLLFLNKYYISVQFGLPTTKQEGHVCFENHGSLKFKEIMQEFGWLTKEVKSLNIVNEVLDVAVQKMNICLNINNDKLQLKAFNISIFKEQLDTGLLMLKNVELDVCTKLVKGCYVTSFSLRAFISEALYAKLEYDPERNSLSGQVKVIFAKCASAVDVLKLFQASSNSYVNMKSILRDDFMNVFNSNLKITAQPGLTALLNVSIGLPSKHSTHYSLQYLQLEIQDALKICCENTYVLTAFSFEYRSKSGQEKAVSTSHLFLEVHKLNSKEDMRLDFNLVKTEDDTGTFSAKVSAGPGGGFLKLSSAIDLACASVPEIPKFDVGLPKLFDIELLSGSITFQLKPFFQPSSFDINILINHWQILTDPKLILHKVILKTTWEKGNYPQLCFTDCSLNFLGHELSLNGRLNSEEVYIECHSAKRLSEYTPAQFQSILNDYTPHSELRPVVPTNIGLPNMIVELKKLIIHLKETSQEFQVNTALICDSPWRARFGPQSLTVREIGGAMEWTKRENKKQYKAFLYGSLEIFGTRTDMEMLLGKDIDSIVMATVTCPQCLGYGQITDNLLNSEAIVPYDQYNPSDSSLSELAPSSMHNISLVSASIALNISKRQFFLSSAVQGWGTGSFLMGYLVDQSEMDYVVSLTLESDTKFSKFSQSLAFVDELILLRSMDVLVSSCNIQDMLVIKKSFSHSFCQSWVQTHIQNPFYESKLLNEPELAKYGVRAGTTIYAQIDIAQSKGVCKLLELGDQESLQHDISVMAYIGKAKTETNIEIRAWIPRILLFTVLEFSNIHLLYKVNKASEFELSGRIALLLNLTDSTPTLKFDGQLVVCPDYSDFRTKSCGEVVNRPCGIDVCINSLTLAFKMYHNGESPDLTISGKLRIGQIHLTCEFILKGIAFRVFKIELARELRLSALLKCYLTDWPVMLDITIKEGQFYYCSQHDLVPTYDYGHHLKALITLFDWDFRVEAHMPDRENIILSGRSMQKLDLFFAKITGECGHTDEGPAITYRGSEKSLTLTLGVEILNTSCFEGEVKYCKKDGKPLLEGTIKCPLKFLWINEPSMKVQWTKNEGFKIVEFNLFGDVPGFSLLKAIGKIAKVVVGILTGGLSYDWKLRLRTDKNPDPKKHLVHIVLYGEIYITILGIFDFKAFPLPEMHILLPRVDNFSVSKLPKYILKALWDSIGYTIRSLLDYLNPFKLLWRSAGMIWDSVKGAVKAVVNVAKKVGQAAVSVGRAVGKGVKKLWRGFRSLFGRSAFIVDVDNGMVLGYIRGGRAGKHLWNFKYTVEQFGPVITANAVGTMAHDIHKYLKSCVTAREYGSDENDKSRDEIDGENSEIEKGLKELKERAEQLSQNLTIVAGNVLAVSDISVGIIDTGGISIEWFVYNPEENTFYNKDKGDIEYHIKVTAIVIKDGNLDVISVYDNVFTDQINRVNMDNDGGVTTDKFELSQQSKLSEQMTTDGKFTEAEVSQDTLSGQDTLEKLEQVCVAQIDTDQIPDEQPVDKVDSEGEDLEASQSGNNQLGETSQHSDNQQEGESEPPRRIKFDLSDTSVSLSNSTIKLSTIMKETVCLNVSIRPTVTLEVKMLPPDKIASEMVDTNKLADGDNRWMDDMKKEIESNGRINEVTLEGRKVCKQQILNQASKLDSALQFTAQCIYGKKGLTVAGDIKQPIPDAHCYLIQLVDESDITFVIKLCKSFSPNLHFELEVSNSDFPAISSGPYHVSVIALNSDFETCAEFTDTD